MKKIFCIINFISIFFVFAEAKLIPFSKENKIGFVDENLNIIIDPKYDSINKYNGNSFVMYLKQTQINVLVNENGIRNVQNILPAEGPVC